MISAKPALSNALRPHKLHPSQAAPDYDQYEIAPANMALRYYLITDIVALISAFAMATLLAAHVNFYYFGRTVLAAAATRSALAVTCVLVAAGLLFWFAHRQHYAKRLTWWTETQQILSGTGLCALLHGFFQLFNHAEFSRLWLVGTWGFAAVFLLLGRSMVREILKQTGHWNIPTLRIDASIDPNLAAAIDRQGAELGLDVCATADEAVVAARLLAGESWGSILASYNAEAVALNTAYSVQETCDLWVMQWEKQKIPCVRTAHQPITKAARLHRWLPQFGKRGFDLVASAFAIVVLSPLFLVLAILIKRDGGPVFHADTRVGIDGKLIKCLKFRSMVLNADRELVRYLRTSPAAAAEWAQYQKLRQDPRITAVGSFIRKTSLDELPQLINVFWGEMTLVGPRPIIPNQKQAYGPNITYYHTVRPGITGLWQVSGRNRLTFRQRAKLDKWYVRNWSLWLDIVILLRTFPVLLLRKGAY